MSAYIDLHLHLDGSLPLPTIFHLAQTQQIPLPAYDEEALRPYISVTPDCGDLNEYLRCFDLPLQLLQTPEALTEATYALLAELQRQQVLYVEIRFAPQLHQRRQLTQTEVVAAVLKGLFAGQKDFSVQAQLILCCMRGAQEENFETLRVAQDFLGQGVCAVDLAGAEALYPTQRYQELFKQAQQLHLPFTIHAGEAAGWDSVQTALEFGAQRIGHGIRCMEDARLVETLRQQQIPLEVCPQSNLDTHAIPGGISHYPIMQLLDAGLYVTINTDNMTVSRTTPQQEFALLEKNFALTVAQKEKLLKNAVFAAFLPETQKLALWERMKNRL